ncbi:hypothetical protein BDR26DRAFT_870434 [Obelidium mucronatum]|nr:hypothetical protein BDR26DRAFT_870434 [Obelidium mucronatum]
MLLHEFPGQCLSTNRRLKVGVQLVRRKERPCIANGLCVLVVLKSCEGCRLSNKKCTRDESGCGRCLKKGIPCVYSRNSTRSKAYRELKEKKKLGLLPGDGDSAGAPSPPARSAARSPALKTGAAAAQALSQPAVSHGAAEAARHSGGARRIQSCSNLPAPRQHWAALPQPQPVLQSQPVVFSQPQQHQQHQHHQQHQQHYLRRGDVFIDNYHPSIARPSWTPPQPLRAASMSYNTQYAAQQSYVHVKHEDVNSMLPLSVRQQQQILHQQHQMQTPSPMSPPKSWDPNAALSEEPIEVSAESDLVVTLAKELVSFSRSESSMSISALVD